MGNLIAKINGWKTYITLGLGAVVAVLGHFWGPMHVGPIDIPLVDSKTMWEIVWAAATGIFMRHGITKSGPVPPPSA